MRITKLAAKDFMCLESFEQDVPEGGLVVAGGNGRGKSTVLRLVQQGLLAAGVSPSSVRLGAERAEIRISLGDVVVRRLISKEGTSTVSVKTTDGMTRNKPQTWLAQISGSVLDPLAVFFAPPKERRALVLKALPVTVTREQLRAFWPDAPAEFDVTGHGLEVLARAHRIVYERRTGANAAAKAARSESERLALEAAAIRTRAPGEAMSVDAADRAVTEARAALQRLETRDAESKRAIERTASTRAKVDELRANARDIGNAQLELKASLASVHELHVEIAELERLIGDRRNALVQAESDVSRARTTIQRCESDAQQADALEAALANAGPEPVDAAEIEAFRTVLAGAERCAGDARAFAAAEAATQRARDAIARTGDADAEAKRLDTIVRALADEAPRSLPGTDAIPGLSVDSDDLTLDGKRLEALCGAEQLRLAVQIAKRARSGCDLPLLVVDGLERLDTEQFAVFLEEATAGGWQVLGSRVTGGDLHFEAIERGDAPEQAVTPPPVEDDESVETGAA